MRFLDPLIGIFRGKAVTIPPMDGALKPNALLEDANVLATAERPDVIAVDGDTVLYSSGRAIYRLDSGEPVARFESMVTALAVGSDGTMAVGFNSGAVSIGDKRFEGFTCPTALAFDGNQLLVCNGSDATVPEDWARDLMGKVPSGSLWRVDSLTGERTCLARGLAYPNGVVVDNDQGRIIFSESWHHRLSAVQGQGGQVSTVLPRLPAYPSRIAPASQGYLLALFAPLNRLVEFVLQEDRYREDMMREIESKYWIAPTLAANQSFLEPLQNGGVRSMGVHKPWSPTRSYGLFVLLDRHFRPVASYHSRANGRFHGVTSAIEAGGHFIVTSKGGNAILGIEARAGAL